MHAQPPKDIPAADAPDEAFTFADVIVRESVVSWAAGVFADVVHHDDKVLVAACKILRSNSPEMSIAADHLLKVLERAHAA